MAENQDEKVYATGALLSASQGSLVDEVDLRISDMTFLIKRIDLMDYLNADVWQQPVTAHVRAAMIFGVERSLAQSKDASDFLGSMRSVIRAAAVMAPADLIAKKINIAQIRQGQCVPLFATQGDDLLEGQRILVSTEDRETSRDAVLQIEYDLAAKDYTEKTIKTKERALAKARINLEQTVALHWEDVTVLAREVMDRAPGAVSRFRTQETNVVESVSGPKKNADSGGSAVANKPAA